MQLSPLNSLLIKLILVAISGCEYNYSVVSSANKMISNNEVAAVISLNTMQYIIPVFLRKFLLQVRNIVFSVRPFICKTFLIN